MRMDIMKDLNAYSLICLLLMVYFCLTAVFYASTTLMETFVWLRKGIKDPKRILLVIAHPDDECLFFGPTILGLLKKHRKHFYLLCLSPGDFQGKGSQRKKELWNSCITMGIPSENVVLLSHDHLKDDPSILWSQDLISRALLSQINTYQIDTLITFDDYGVSGHINHVAIFKCVEEMLASKQLPSFCSAYALESVSLCRKYITGLLDVPVCYMTRPYMYVANGKRRNLLMEAMSCHESQHVWFRKLYLMFSRYLMINTLRPILPPHSQDNGHLKRE